MELSGLTDREVKVNVDVHRLETFELSFYDIESAIASENVSMSGGDVKLGESRRTIRVVGEFENVKEIENIVVKNEDQ